jgi:hypothetical protein
MMTDKNDISPIENFLLQNPEYSAFEVLIPENVALCYYNEKMVHIIVDENSTLVDTIDFE